MGDEGSCGKDRGSRIEGRVISLNILSTIYYPLSTIHYPRSRFAPSKFLENVLPSLPGFIARPLVGLFQISRVFAGAHKTIPCAFVDDGVELFAGFFHQRVSPWDRRVDALVGAAVESVDGSVDPGDVFFFIRPGAVEDEGRDQVWACRGEAKGLPAAVGEARDRDIAVGGGQFGDVIGHRVQVGGDLVLGQRGDGL